MSLQTILTIEDDAAKKSILSFERGAMKYQTAILVLLFAQSAHAEQKEPDYEAVSESIRSRIIALQEKHPLLKNMSTMRPLHHPNNLSFRHAVKWVLDDPTQRPTKMNARRPIYETDDAFWFRVVFYRGRYGGAAMHRPIRFGDLRVWLSYGYNKDSSVIGIVTKVIREEKKKFDAKYPGLSDKPDKRLDHNQSIGSDKVIAKSPWFKQDFSSDGRDALVELSKKKPFSELAPVLLKVLAEYPGKRYAWSANKPSWNSDRRLTSQDRTYLMASSVWQHHMKPTNDPSKIKVLLALLQKASRRAEKNILIGAIKSYQWNTDGEKALADIAENKEESPGLRNFAVGALLHRSDINTYMPIAIEIILAHKEDLPRHQAFSSNTNLGNRLFTLNAKNRHAVISTGFEILSEIPDEEFHAGYFIATRLGFILKVNNEFKPDQKAGKYRGDTGLKDDFFIDTVKNAIEWHSKNWKEHSAVRGRSQRN